MSYVGSSSSPSFLFPLPSFLHLLALLFFSPLFLFPLYIFGSSPEEAARIAQETRWYFDLIKHLLERIEQEFVHLFLQSLHSGFHSRIRDSIPKFEKVQFVIAVLEAAIQDNCIILFWSQPGSQPLGRRRRRWLLTCVGSEHMVY